MVTRWSRALCAIAVGAMFGVVQAQTVTTAGPRESAAAGELGKPVFRASQLDGVKVKNKAGEEVGKIEDLVIDGHSGAAKYVALSVGGFLGLGDKLFAIPYDAFMFEPGDRRRTSEPAVTSQGKLNDVIAVLDVSKETFKDAQGFDKDKWPNMVDATWRTANDRTYGSILRRKLDRPETSETKEMVRVSELIGANVKNAKNETVGEIDDLMIDDGDGHVRYAALSVGGFLGLGTKLFAIPLSTFRVAVDANGKATVVLSVTKESFKGIEGFDKEHWPNLADKSWRDRNDQSYRAWPRETN